MIAQTMITLNTQRGPQSVPSGFGTVEQVFPSVFNEKFITVISRVDVKTEAEAIAQRIFHVVDVNHDCPTRSAEFITKVEVNGVLYNIFAEPKPTVKVFS